MALSIKQVEDLTGLKQRYSETEDSFRLRACAALRDRKVRHTFTTPEGAATKLQDDLKEVMTTTPEWRAEDPQYQNIPAPASHAMGLTASQVALERDTELRALYGALDDLGQPAKFIYLGEREYRTLCGCVAYNEEDHTMGGAKVLRVCAPSHMGVA